MFLLSVKGTTSHSFRQSRHSEIIFEVSPTHTPYPTHYQIPYICPQKFSEINLYLLIFPTSTFIQAMCYWDHHISGQICSYLGFPSGSDGKGSACNAEGQGVIPRSGRSPGEGNGDPPQCSCLGSPVDRGA